MVSEARRELTALGHPEARILCCVADVAEEAAMTAAATSTHARFGAIHALINSAGMSLPQEFEATSAQQFEQVLRVNVLGTRNAVAACLPYIRRCTGGNDGGSSEGGRIVFVSSMAGQTGIFGFTAYSASKFALTGFAQALQMEVCTCIKLAVC